MAEAAVVETPRHFYCHVCNQEFQNITSEYTCPVCSDGFIEELPSRSASNFESRDGNDYDMAETNSETSSNASTVHENPLRDFMDPSRLGNLDLMVTNPSSTPILTIRQPADSRRRHHHRLGVNSTGSTSGGENNGAGSSGSAPTLNTYDNFIRDFFISVTGGVPGTNFGGRRGINLEANLTPMFFIGNPGDYAWGHDGLDSVITFLLNQMDPNGPPPMTPQKIQEIPKVEITQDHINKKMQCSVCLEDFQLKEPCRQLACLHIFHDTCILPWLELHSSCPICRDTFTEQDQTNQEDDSMDRIYSNIRRQFVMDDVMSLGTSTTDSPSSTTATTTTSATNGGSSSGQNVAGGQSTSSNHSSAQSSSHSSQVDSQQQSQNSNPSSSNNNINFHLDDILD